MRRQILVAVVGGLALLLGVGFVSWAATQGLLTPNGKGKRMIIAAEQLAKRGDVQGAQAKLEEMIASMPDSPWTDQALLSLGQLHEDQGHLLEARAVYRLLVEKFPNSPRVGDAQARLGRANVSLLFSSTLRDRDTAYQVKPGDTLGVIAKTHGTTIDLIKKANSLSSDIIRVGQKLKVPVGKFRIHVDKSQNQLLVTEDDQFFKLYQVATGKDNSTPVGTFKITDKLPNPVWYTQGAVVPPDSPENILGTRWMGIDKKGYGIHGSVDRSGIGKQVTAGCVRMHNEDVEELFAIVPSATEVTIVD